MTMAPRNTQSVFALRRPLLTAMLLSVVGFTHCDDVPRNVVIEGASDGAVLTTAQVVSLDVVTQHVEVARVELYDGRHKMGEVEASSYGYAWDVTPAENGRHKWQAFAHDVDGTIWPSLPVFVIVDIDPGVRTAPRPGVERRCAELHDTATAGCLCSEPLNTEEWTAVGDTANPSDSPGATECAGGDAYRGGVDELAVVAEDGMPAGNAVDWVWRHDKPSGGYTLSGDTAIPASAKRVCARSYFRLSPNYVPNPSPPCDGGKFQEIAVKGGSDWDFQIGSGGGSSRLQMRIGIEGFQNQEPDRVGSLDDEDCEGQWCRVETCIGGDFAGGTGDVFVEAYVERLSDGKRIDWTRHNVSQSADRPGSPFPDLNWNYIWIANGFRGQDFFCENPPTDSWREISHGMVAWWDTDTAAKFIGPAREVEGGL